MHHCFIALGSNLGDREKNISEAVARLVRHAIVPDRMSSLLENPAVGGPADSPAFLNAVVSALTTLNPHDVLAALLDVEHELGRVRREKWEPRIIDLDLLLYDEQIIDTPDLKVPHPLMRTREFVLKPLAEIAPEFVHPVLKKTIGELLAQLR